jgi:DNA invertase Pin-like site-specific DNA recombinase
VHIRRERDLLDNVPAAAEQLRQVEDERLEARKRLRATIVTAYTEGISVARIAREAGVSRPTVYEFLKPRQ